MLTEKLQAGLRILFIGFNPSLRSYERGFNYAGRGNRFYQVLFQAGLTARLYSPEESGLLTSHYGYGFTNIVARPTRRADELRPEEYKEGAVILRQKLALYRPQIACYVGKGVYMAFAMRRNPTIGWGFADKSQVEGVRDFVGPATSGLVRMTLSEQVAIYRTLTRALQAC